jgi:hypothetical protein
MVQLPHALCLDDFPTQPVVDIVAGVHKCSEDGVSML